MKEPEGRMRHEQEETYQIKDARGEEYCIRKARKEDLEAVAKIERGSIPDPWSRKGFAEALGRPEVIFLVAESLLNFSERETEPAPEFAEKEAERREIAGYCVLYTAADEGEIPTIAVDVGSRRRGIAAKLLKAAFAEGEKSGVKRVYLEARQSNAGALALYESCGFVVDGKRPGFYSNPTEDAVLLHRELSATEDAMLPHRELAAPEDTADARRIDDQMKKERRDAGRMFAGDGGDDASAEPMAHVSDDEI